MTTSHELREWYSILFQLIGGIWMSVCIYIAININASLSLSLSDHIISHRVSADLTIELSPLWLQVQSDRIVLELCYHTSTGTKTSPILAFSLDHYFHENATWNWRLIHSWLLTTRSAKYTGKLKMSSKAAVYLTRRQSGATTDVLEVFNKLEELYNKK